MLKIYSNSENKEIKLNDLTEKLLIKYNMLRVFTNNNEYIIIREFYDKKDNIRRYTYTFKNDRVKDVYVNFEQLKRKLIRLDNNLKARFKETDKLEKIFKITGCHSIEEFKLNDLTLDIFNNNSFLTLETNHNEYTLVKYPYYEHTIFCVRNRFYNKEFLSFDTLKDHLISMNEELTKEIENYNKNKEVYYNV